MSQGANYNLIGVAAGFTGGTVTTPIQASNGSASAPSYSFTSATNMGMYTDGSSLLLSVAGALVGTFGSGGSFTAAASLRASTYITAVTYGVFNTGNTAGLGIGIGNDANGVYMARMNPATYPLTLQAQDFSTGVKPGIITSGILTIAKTANYTLTFSDMAVHFTNAGATGSVQFTLPTPQAGYWARFTCTAAQILTVVTPSGSIFGPNLIGATRTITGTTASAQYSSFDVVCYDGTNYVLRGVSGTVT